MEHLRFIELVAGSGGGWVIHVLLLFSLLSLGVIVERIWIVLRQARYMAAGLAGIGDRLETSEADEVVRRLEPDSVLFPMARDVLRHAPGGRAAMAERMEVQLALQRRRLEKRLMVLGTLGNNAPFLGLLGTVLGVIHAFQDLAAAGGQGAGVVMAGLAEALVATAVGIMVALPCVAAYNYIHKRIDDVLSDADHFGRRLIAVLER